MTTSSDALNSPIPRVKGLLKAAMLLSVVGRGRLAALLVAATIVPFLARYHYDVPGVDWLKLGFPNPVVDLVGWIKASTLHGCGVVAFLAVVILRIVGRVQIPRLVVWLSSLLFLQMVLAAAASPWRAVTLHGSPYLHDGLLTWTANVALFVAAATVTKRQGVLLIKAIAVTGVFALGLAILERHRTLLNNWAALEGGFQAIVLGKLATKGVQLVRESNDYFVVAFGNRTFAGLFAALVVPVAVTWARMASGRNSRLMALTAASGAIAFEIGTLSRAGFVGALGGSLFGLCIASRALGQASPALGDGGRMRARRWSSSLLRHATLWLLVIGTGFLALPVGKLIGRLKRAIHDTSDLLAQPGDWVRKVYAIPERPIVDGIERLRVAIDGPPLVVESQAKTVRFLDEEEQPLTLVPFASELRPLAPKYAAYTMRTWRDTNSNWFSIAVAQRVLTFAATEHGFRILHGRRLARPRLSPSLPIFPPHLFAERGFIWNRTLPLVLAAPVFGRGPGTFALDFPNDDAAALVENFERTDLVIDKAHSLYLGMAHAAGLPVLVIFLFGVAAALRQSWIRGAVPPLTFVPAAATAGMVGWLLAGLATDATVHGGAAFWVLWGLSLSHPSTRDQAAIAHRFS